MRSEQQSENEYTDDVLKINVAAKKRRKVKCLINHNLSLYMHKKKNESVCITLQKGSRIVTSSKEEWREICDLKETVLLCAAFVEGQ